MFSFLQPEVLCPAQVSIIEGTLDMVENMFVQKHILSERLVHRESEQLKFLLSEWKKVIQVRTCMKAATSDDESF